MSGAWMRSVPCGLKKELNVFTSLCLQYARSLRSAQAMKAKGVSGWGTP